MSKKLKQLSEMTNEELWQLFPIILSEYTNDWAKNYLAEKQNLENIIGKESIIRINHIGSTAVPGQLAKPTIDILLEIKDNTDTDQLINKLEKSGYIYSPQPDKPIPHMMFMKGYTTRGFEGQPYHLHIRYAGDWDELYFRDFLISHPETVDRYTLLKQQLKDKFEHDRDGYTQAKTGFIREITALARKEFPDRHNKNYMK
ncbi:MAG: GrpB family protein [Tannerella sp.]|jgi:GrpB-like predicted nucleotidyltransferase (UPF0157 family)|nr:GrpB family protein [Tannerella sp.]